jgi:hypothetical protein
MFTRHLYKDDEVIAALRWCIRKGRTKEALFWCLELLDSEMKETLMQELYETWIWYFGIGKLSALVSFANLETDQEILRFVCGLSRLPTGARDRSTLVLLLHGAMDEKQPDRASGFPCLKPLFEKMNCSDLEKAFANAAYQGKARLAFDLSRPLWSEKSRVYEILDGIQRIKHKGLLTEQTSLFEFNESGTEWPTRACAIAAICLDRKRLTESLKLLNLDPPPDLIASLEEWKECAGRRKRRIFPIPHESLYYKTERGLLSNKETTLKELYGINEECLEMACPFWRRVVEEEVPWLDDDRKESFYDLYFPDDIPDEWSKQDQEKSHGYGCLINTEIPNYTKYIDRWFSNMTTRSVWLNNRDLRNLCSQEKVWREVFDDRWDSIVATWCLTPVKERRLVLADDA